jgi:excisionase family DNA binding protein
MNELLAPEQVAGQLQVSARTVRQWLRDGDLIGIKVGKSWRIHPADIRRLLDEQLLTARLERASRIYPDHRWMRGYCRECGMLVPVPDMLGGNHWVCSSTCQDAYDSKAEAVVGRGSAEFAQCASTVIPPF